MLGKTKQFFSFVLPGVIKPMRVLWNEVMGFLFLCLGLLPIPSAYRAWQDMEKGVDGGFRVLLTCSFCAVMLYFGISSFLRARKIQRS